MMGPRLGKVQVVLRDTTPMQEFCVWTSSVERGRMACVAQLLSMKL